MERRFWLRWANEQLKQRGLLIQKLPDDLQSGSLFLHLIEIVHPHVSCYISGHILFPTNEKERDQNFEVLKKLLESRAIPVADDFKHDDQLPLLLKSVAQYSVYLYSIPLLHANKFEAKIVQILERKLDHEILSLNYCVENINVFLHFLLFFCLDPSFPIDFTEQDKVSLVNQVLTEIETEYKIVRLLEPIDIVENFSKLPVNCKLLLFKQFIDCNFDKERFTTSYKLKGAINRILYQLESQKTTTTQCARDYQAIINECKITAPKDADQFIQNLESASACISLANNQNNISSIQVEILAVANTFLDKIKQYQEEKEHAEGIIVSFTEKIMLEDNKHKHQAQRDTIYILALKEQLENAERKVLKEKKKRITVEHLAKQILIQTQKEQDEKFSQQLATSIQQTAQSQHEQLNEQHHEIFDTPTKNDLFLDALTVRMEDALHTVGEDVRPVIAAQHFYFLHQIIDAQKREIEQLKQTIKQKPTHLPRVQESGTQMEEERKSLTERIKQLRADIAGCKSSLNKNE